jgi:uracil-DNA glycosylase
MRALSPRLDNSWLEAVADQFDQRCIDELIRRVQAERDAGKTIYPPLDQVFAALNRTPLRAVRAVILGQDPYIRPGQAHGFAFSVPRGVPKPPSLKNVLLGLFNDLGYPVPTHGCLEAWADQGVLLLNTLLTFEEGKSGSHAKFGWEAFTDGLVRAIDARSQHVAFLLWGGKARKKAKLIDSERHLIHVSAHPSPLAHGKFLLYKPFSAANKYLLKHQMGEIDWELGP